MARVATSAILIAVPLRFVIDESMDLVLTTAEGEVSDADLLDHAPRLAAIPERPLRELVDFTSHSGGTVTLASVRNMAEFLRDNDSNLSGGKLALVGADDEVFGILRVFEAHRSHEALAIRVFRARDEGLRWLGIEPSVA